MCVCVSEAFLVCKFPRRMSLACKVVLRPPYCNNPETTLLGGWRQRRRWIARMSQLALTIGHLEVHLRGCWASLHPPKMSIRRRVGGWVLAMVKVLNVSAYSLYLGCSAMCSPLSVNTAFGHLCGDTIANDGVHQTGSCFLFHAKNAFFEPRTMKR